MKLLNKRTDFDHNTFQPVLIVTLSIPIEPVMDGTVQSPEEAYAKFGKQLVDCLKEDV